MADYLPDRRYHRYPEVFEGVLMERLCQQLWDRYVDLGGGYNDTIGPYRVAFEIWAFCEDRQEHRRCWDGAICGKDSCLRCERLI